MERDSRGYSLVVHLSRFSGVRIHKTSDLLLVLQHFLGPRRQDTDFVFVIGNLSIQASLKRGKDSENPAYPLDHF